MKMILFLLSLLYASEALEHNHALRRRHLAGYRDTFECILIEVATDFDHDDDTHEHMCQGQDSRGNFDKMYYIDDNNDVIPDLEEMGLDVMHYSGRFKLVLTNVVENNSPVITTTPGTKVDIVDLESNQSQDRKLAQTSGESKVAIVRVTTRDGPPDKTSQELSDAFFGTSGSPHNLARRYDLCSFGKLKMVPANPTDFKTSVNGVGELELDEPSEGQDIFGLMNQVTDLFEETFDNPPTFFDHVAYIFPEGTTYGSGGSDNWLAFAYVKGFLSVFNDLNAVYLSHQVHEFGHNLGLYHASYNGLTYGDRSGVMGYGYKLEDGPQMCFNAAKSWQLGWYREKAIQINENGDPNASARSIYLSFFGDYDNVPSNSESEAVLLKIGHYHLIYNFRKGINSQTQDWVDRVTITYMKRNNDLSRLDAALRPGEDFEFQAGSRTMEIKFCAMTNENGVDKAKISIYPEGSASSCGNFDAALENSAQQRSVPSPTPQPVPSPTPQPVPSPTSQPVPSPTRPPTPSPTRPPVAVSCGASEVKLEVKLTTNDTPQDISWHLSVHDGATIGEIGSYSIQNHEHVHQYCANADDTIVFHLKDTSGKDYPGGKYVLSVDNQVYSEGDIVAEEVDYIEATCPNANESRFQLILNTGYAPEHVSWTLNAEETELSGGGPWPQHSGKPINFFSSTCLDTSLCYTFKMMTSLKDQYTNKGQGLDRGSYEVTWNKQDVKSSTFETGDKEVTKFGDCESFYYEEPEAEPEVCDCTDEPVNWMKNYGWECEGNHFLTTKCNKNGAWRAAKYCQLSCYRMGFGYEGDVCNCG
mmetsp:Transcript_9045/g.13886  ORF Transcript_9045/g.13886 Transcript_9045/m.13886 type:complete len:813 (-) Transcript_9045:188-2626(-)